MTHIFTPTPATRQKWRVQADKAGAHLKKSALTRDEIKIGFVFDDGVITVTLPAETIRSLDAMALSDKLYELVLEAAQKEGSA